MAGEPCSRCGAEPRAGKNKWGRKCLAEQRRRLRELAKKGTTPVVPLPEKAVVPDVVPPSTAVVPASTTRVRQAGARRVRHCEECRERDKQISLLEGDAAYLKQQLAAGAEAPGTSTAEHGPRCACLACQSMRWPGH